MRSIRFIIRLVLLVVLVAVAARRYVRSADMPNATSPVPRPAPADTAYASLPIRPDSALTPGAALAVTVVDICTPGYSRKVRDVPSAVKQEVYAAYGIARHDPGAFEVDHLISLELGGSNSKRNLWPESYRTSPWNARVKDALENELHRRVCSGSLDLATAQHDISSDWIAAYQRYFHRKLPRPSAVSRSHAR